MYPYTKILNGLNAEIYRLEGEKNRDILKIAELRCRYAELQSMQLRDEREAFEDALLEELRIVRKRSFQRFIIHWSLGITLFIILLLYKPH